MLEIPKLDFGFNDAENYKRRENKNLFNRIFLHNESLDGLCKSNNFFLVGEKGTGKTAYAVYMSNNNYKNNFADLKYIRETEYNKFLTLKKKKHLELSDYTNIWKVIIFLLLAQQINEREKRNPIFSKFSKFQNLKKAIDEYYANAFSPEIIYAIQFVEESKLAAELIAKYAQIGGEQKSGITFSEQRFQTNLLFIQKKFEDALRSLKLKNSYILFIDGIDIRPSSIPYGEYLECVKGLANAIWSINNDFFPTIKDSPGRLRAVLLIRPDIFDSLTLQNQNNKLRDNSILLDWRTRYAEYRDSPIFQLSDLLLSYQQKNELTLGEAWDYYFPFDAPKVISKQQYPSSFINFLRYSLYRPRDIVTMLKVLQENFIEEKRDSKDVFNIQDLANPNFTRKFSNYLLGEIKDQVSFYYSSSDYEMFLKFFEYLKGSYHFSYNTFISAFSNFKDFLFENKKEVPEFCETADTFLQFLYDLNILCYIEKTYNERFISWCFRERSTSNIKPKIKKYLEYEIHYGMRKSLNVGKSFL